MDEDGPKDEERPNPLFKRLSSRPYSAVDDVARLERFRRMSTSVLEHLLERERQKLFKIRQDFPAMDYLSNPQIGKMRAKEQRIILIERVLDERDAQAAATHQASETAAEIGGAGSDIKPQDERFVARREFIQRRLVQNGWSLNKLAIEAKLDPGTVRNYVNGKSRSYPDTRKRIADALSVNVEDLPE